MSKYKNHMYTSSEDEDYMAAMEIILCETHTRPSHERNPDLVIAHVYVGNIGNAENYNLLRKYGITHVLNCAGVKGPKSYNGSPYEGLDIEYKEIIADDTESYDMSQHFRECFKFLDRVKRKGGCALVHCAQGINRSVAVCIAYIMVDKNYTLLKAVKHLQKLRGCVLSNRAFQQQLVQFAREFGSLGSPEELDKILPKVEIEEEEEQERVVEKLPAYGQNGYSSAYDKYDSAAYDKYDSPAYDKYDSAAYDKYDSAAYDKSYNYSDKYDADKSFGYDNLYGKLETSLQIIEREESELNGKTEATGSSIFEDYLRRMKQR